MEILFVNCKLIYKRKLRCKFKTIILLLIFIEKIFIQDIRAEDDFIFR